MVTANLKFCGQVLNDETPQSGVTTSTSTSDDQSNSSISLVYYVSLQLHVLNDLLIGAK